MWGVGATLAAYHQARERAAAAAEVEATILHMLVYEAEERGMSSSEIASLLGIPRTKLARERVRSAMTPDHLPGPWVTADGYVAAYNAAWDHEPGQQIDQAPFTVEELPDGTRRYTVTPPGTARRSDQ